ARRKSATRGSTHGLPCVAPPSTLTTPSTFAMKRSPASAVVQYVSVSPVLRGPMRAPAGLTYGVVRVAVKLVVPAASVGSVGAAVRFSTAGVALLPSVT